MPIRKLLKRKDDGSSGKYTCYECGGNMTLHDDILICDECKHSVDLDFYGYEESYDEFYRELEAEKEPPVGCRACGGPYPHCKTSCNIFDD